MSATQEYGFVSKDGMDWSTYAKYRPIYPTTFFDRVFSYHTRKPGANWSTAHDVGAGAGIVSGRLAMRFSQVIVSDPNAEYLATARQNLAQPAAEQSASPFVFLEESGEHSSVASGTVDLITACASIHWTDTVLALRTFHRELRAGGTAVAAHYGRPRLVDSTRAERAWSKIFARIARASGQGEVFRRGGDICSAALTTLEFPEDQWGDVERIYINTRGTLEAFRLAEEFGGESKVKASEKIEWVEDDAGWVDYQGVEWLKKYVQTWVPLIPEDDIREIWDEIEAALGAEKTKIETPAALIFATKK